MDLASTTLGVLLLAGGVGLMARLSYRLLRWARSSGRGTQAAVGAVLTEITQGPAMREAKQGNNRKDGDAGDPPNTD